MSVNTKSFLLNLDFKLKRFLKFKAFEKNITMSELVLSCFGKYYKSGNVEKKIDDKENVKLNISISEKHHTKLKQISKETGRSITELLIDGCLFCYDINNFNDRCEKDERKKLRELEDKYIYLKGDKI